MQTHIARTLKDIQDVEELRQDETWKHARAFLAKAPDDPFADHLRWLEDEGRCVACVQVFLHQYPIGCSQLGMCLPEYPFVPPELRRRGYFKRLMSDLFDWMAHNGYPLAYDHGGKGIYTGIGYAPCFHHTMVLIRVDDALRIQAPQRAVKATEAELTADEDLFRQPFALGRGLQCRDERWRPDARCVRVIRRSDGPAGFIVLGEVTTGRTATGMGSASLVPPEGGELLTITDAWSASRGAAAALLRAAAEEAGQAGAKWLRLNCPVDDPLIRVGVLAGGELRHCAGQERDDTADGEDVDAFYLSDLKLALTQLLPELNARWLDFGKRGPAALRVRMNEEEAALGLDGQVTVLDDAPSEAPALRLPRKAMTQALMGYATPTELSLIHEGCQVPDACREVADALFRIRKPHLMHENWAFATVGEFGLVP